MIRVQVTERMVFEATEFVNDLVEPSFIERHDYKEEHKLIGAIGEIALIDYCWNNDLLAFKNEGRSADVRLFSGQTIEVKTQKVLSEPKVHYVVNVASRQKVTEFSDFMFFTRLQFVAGKADALWLLGGCSRDKFWRLSKPNLAAGATAHQIGAVKGVASTIQLNDMVHLSCLSSLALDPAPVTVTILL